MKKEKSGQIPTENEWFEVDPRAIDQSIFHNKVQGALQERTRNRILEALTEMNRNPHKYGKKFKTMMPKKTWDSKTVEELKEMACELGDHIADKVEQALEWAQRITNGETWEQICNLPDTANWHRLIKWEKGYARRSGGARLVNQNVPATVIGSINFYFNEKLDDTVPLVVSYEE